MNSPLGRASTCLSLPADDQLATCLSKHVVRDLGLHRCQRLADHDSLGACLSCGVVTRRQSPVLQVQGWWLFAE